jgi:hypothetical protein
MRPLASVRTIALLTLVGSAGACLLGGRTHGSPHAGSPIVSVTYLTHEPPPERAESATKRPYADAVWVGGHWTARGDNYAWASGRWVRPPADKSTWDSGKWEHAERGWYYTEGQWR